MPSGHDGVDGFKMLLEVPLANGRDVTEVWSITLTLFIIFFLILMNRVGVIHKF